MFVPLCAYPKKINMETRKRDKIMEIAETRSVKHDKTVNHLTKCILAYPKKNGNKDGQTTNIYS